MSSPEIFGVPFFNGTEDQVFASLQRALIENRRCRIGFVNAHYLNLAYEDERYKKHLIEGFDLLLPDGVGVRIALRFTNDRLIQNLNGTDLFPKILDWAQENHLSFFYLGAKPGVLEDMCDKLKMRNPGIQIMGIQNGYYENEDQVVHQINDSGAHILVVGMGAPYQERFVFERQANLKCPFVFAMGGVFDFYSERVKRAPKWMRKAGLEWLFRLMGDPFRLFKRYVIGNPKFLWRILCKK